MFGCRCMDSVSDKDATGEWKKIESKAFIVRIEMHQGWILSPLLFVIV